MPTTSLTPLLPKAQTAIDAAVPFQLEDAARLVRKKKQFVGHKTGLGKTFITLIAWAQLPNVRRVIIVGTSSSLGTWRRVLRQWGGVDPIIMIGGHDPNWQTAKNKRNSGIWMCTPATAKLLLDAEVKHVEFDLFIADEVHKYMRNRTATWKSLLKIDCEYFYPASATWASRGPQDLYPILHMFDKKVFSSYWRFVETWCFVGDASFGKEVFGVRNADKLKAMLNGQYYVTKNWSQVGTQFLPDGFKGEPVIRRIELIDMYDQQRFIYEGMAQNKEARFKDEYLLAQNSLDQLTRSLQLALCPQIHFPEAEAGAAMDWLVEKLASHESAVVFVPFKSLVKIAADHLRAAGYERKIYSLFGGLSVDVVDVTTTEWRKQKGIIFCTISFAQSFDLSATDYAYFFGFDWDPNNNIQAEGRLRRFDTVFTTPCLATYIVVRGTDYEKVQEVVNGKVTNVKQVLSGYGL